MRLTIATLLVLFSMTALATPPDNRPPDNRPPDRDSSSPVSSATSSATADATASSLAKAEGGDAVATSGDSTSESSVGNVTAQGSGDSASNSSVGNITIEGQRQRGTVTIKNTPTSIAPDIYPTVSCFKGASGAASGPGFGFSIGGGKIDEDCVKREYIRLAHAMGLIDRATFMWCKQPSVYEDFGSAEDCLQFEVDNSPALTDCAPACEHEGWLMAAISEEEYLEQQQMVEEKNNQQQNLIQSLQSKERDLSTEVRRLKSIQQQQLREEELKKQRLKELLENDRDG